MTWEQKLLALGALGDASLKMHHVGNWSCAVRGVAIKQGPTESGLMGMGASPEKAVENCWGRAVTELKPEHSLVCRNGDARFSVVRWNGFMWRPEEIQ